MKISSGGGTSDQNEFRAPQRQNRTGQGMPGLLAYEHPETTEARIESPDIMSGFNKACLLKDTVGWQKHLAVHML